ncbi:MAG: hypothetical protein JWN66_2596 [Sphingomonas bacterium]|nr:hypothetical protein [Sphingomonas bacterium]
MGDQNQGGEAQGGNQSNEGGDAEKTKTMADRAGGGSNKGSGLGSNEQLDQAGGQGGGQGN